MKRFLWLLTLIITSLSMAAQSLPLNLKSRAIRLTAASDESLLITTRAGEILLLNALNSTWTDISPEKKTIGPTLEESSFFNKDTGFASGFIISESDKSDIIFHTVNGGKTWKKN